MILSRTSARGSRKRDASQGTVEALQKIVPALRKRFGSKVRIIVRADSGFAREAIMSRCEDNEVFYCFGLARNERLSEQLRESFESLQSQLKEGQLQSPCRSFTEFEHSTLKTWSKARRVIGKAEILPKGDNPRFIVTNLAKDGWGDPTQAARFEPAALYEKFYCARGDMENRLKEQQLDLFADRTSTHWMVSNQLRLWFSVFAHLIMSRLQAEVLKGTELASASIGQVRLRLFKIAARLKVSVRRIHIELCSAYPLQSLFSLVHKRLARLVAATYDSSRNEADRGQPEPARSASRGFVCYASIPRTQGPIRWKSHQTLDLDAFRHARAEAR